MVARNSLVIEIPKKILQGGTARRLVVVDPKEFEKEMRRRWEEKDALEASRAARREWKEGKTRQIASLKELM